MTAPPPIWTVYASWQATRSTPAQETSETRPNRGAAIAAAISLACCAGVRYVTVQDPGHVVVGEYDRYTNRWREYHQPVPSRLEPEETTMPTTNLTGSDYVLAVAHQLIANGVPVDLDDADLDEEQCNLPVRYADADEPTWLRWLEDPEHGWHFTDERGWRCAPICPPDTPPAEAARILADYV